MTNEPWADQINEERDGVWAGYSAWHTWLLGQLGDDAACAFDEMDDTDAWKECLYNVMAERERVRMKSDEEIERLRGVVRTERGRHRQESIDATGYQMLKANKLLVMVRRAMKDAANAYDADTARLCGEG